MMAKTVNKSSILTPKQMKCIYALGRAGGLDSEDLHSLVSATVRKKHVSELTAEEARRVIDRLKAVTGQKADKTPNRATKRQVGLIYALAEQLGWGEDPRRLTAFLEKQYGITHPSFLDARSTSSCILALKAMTAGGRGERKGGGNGKVDGQPDS